MVCALCSACSDDESGSLDSAVATSNPDADFTSYRTFALSNPSAEDLAKIPPDVSVNLEIVSQEIVEQLTEQGLQQVDINDDPDVVAFNLASTSDQSAVYWDCAYDYYWWGYWGYAWTPCATVEPVYTTYAEGTILLGLVDPKLGETVFVGVIQGVQDYTDDLEDRIEYDVERVFDAYPATQTGQ
jgi:hypothetical protein